MKMTRQIALGLPILCLCAFCGCDTVFRPSPILETDQGILETSLNLGQADKGVRGFIVENNWSYSQELITPTTFLLIAKTPQNDTISFECTQKTRKTRVTIYIVKNGNSGQIELTNDLKASLERRFVGL